MRRYLVVAHRTLGGDHLIDHVRSLREEGPCRFLLLVPVEHPSDHTWTEAEVVMAARRRLQEGRDRFHRGGTAVGREQGQHGHEGQCGRALQQGCHDAILRHRHRNIVPAAA